MLLPPKISIFMGSKVPKNKKGDFLKKPSRELKIYFCHLNLSTGSIKKSSLTFLVSLTFVKGVVLTCPLQVPKYL